MYLVISTQAEHFAVCVEKSRDSVKGSPRRDIKDETKNITFLLIS